MTVAYAWWATSFRPFTFAALAAVLAGGAAAVVIGACTTRNRREAPSRGSGIWLSLLVAVAGWELASFLQHPRAEHPTLSSLANEVLGIRPVRALAMVLWLIVGVRLAER